MEFKTLTLFFMVIISFFFVSNAFPRDSSVVKQETVTELNIGTKESSTPSVDIEKEYHIPGRVSCQYEDPTEDIVCQEHCLPKGYSYGICVSHTCSCI